MDVLVSGTTCPLVFYAADLDDSGSLDLVDVAMVVDIVVGLPGRSHRKDHAQDDAALSVPIPADTTSRPVNADSFILLSAGHDGIWGNLDDVTNYSVLSEER